jgi:acetoacetyl-CoA synthetase
MTDVLWRPDDQRIRDAALTRFAEVIGRPGATYEQLWRWSVSDLEQFWAQAARFLGIRWHAAPSAVLGARGMPGTRWFPGGRLSFAEQVLADRDPDAVAVRFRSEAADDGAWTWSDLHRETSRIRQGLVVQGVGAGDRVAAYLPNIPQTLAAFLATASLGAIWSAAAPELGVDSVVSRFARVRPSVLLAVDGYRYKGVAVDREEETRQIADRVGARRVRFGLLDGSGWEAGFPGSPDVAVDFADVPFDHPLWVLYSSGTTGPPKAIVHGHGGVLLELLKTAVLQMDLRPDDRFAWYTTTGWVMWNIHLAPLLAGASVVLFDGWPGGDALWDLAADAGVTVFGASAAWLDGQRRAGAHPRRGRDLSAEPCGDRPEPRTLVEVVILARVHHIKPRRPHQYQKRQ